MFERLVQFEDSTYGVRRGIFFHEYLDADPSSDFWWSTPSNIRKYCKFETIEDAKKKYQSKVKKEKILERL